MSLTYYRSYNYKIESMPCKARLVQSRRESKFVECKGIVPNRVIETPKVN